MLTLFLEFGARTRPQDLWQLIISAARLKFSYEAKAKLVPVRGSCEEARKSILLAMKMILVTKLKVK